MSEDILNPLTGIPSPEITSNMAIIAIVNPPMRKIISVPLQAHWGIPDDVWVSRIGDMLRQKKFTLEQKNDASTKGNEEIWSNGPPTEMQQIIREYLKSNNLVGCWSPEKVLIGLEAIEKMNPAWKMPKAETATQKAMAGQVATELSKLRPKIPSQRNPCVHQLAVIGRSNPDLKPVMRCITCRKTFKFNPKMTDAEMSEYLSGEKKMKYCPFCKKVRTIDGQGYCSEGHIPDDAVIQESEVAGPYFLKAEHEQQSLRTEYGRLRGESEKAWKFEVIDTIEGHKHTKWVPKSISKLIKRIYLDSKGEVIDQREIIVVPSWAKPNQPRDPGNDPDTAEDMTAEWWDYGLDRQERSLKAESFGVPDVDWDDLSTKDKSAILEALQGGDY